jgi:NAD(P)-dependent dehydrogenase (short-subunit alcohol dehydrogenase family)
MIMNKKIALVTGGSRGLGKNMAIALAKTGVDVIVTYRQNQAMAEEVVGQIEAAGAKGAALYFDMNKKGELGNFVQLFQTLLQTQWASVEFSYLINNAGMGATVPITAVTEQLFDEFVNVHFKGIYFLTQKLLPLLTDGASIINISTGTTRFCIPGYSVYSSMKSALETFTRYLAKELGSRQIRANVVAPGPVETDFNEAAIRNNPALKNMLGSITALGRTGVPDDIAGVICFLCSSDSAWINGQRIEVSGGINL